MYTANSPGSNRIRVLSDALYRLLVSNGVNIFSSAAHLPAEMRRSLVSVGRARGNLLCTIYLQL